MSLNDNEREKKLGEKLEICMKILEQKNVACKKKKLHPGMNERDSHALQSE